MITHFEIKELNKTASAQYRSQWLFQPITFKTIAVERPWNIIIIIFKLGDDIENKISDLDLKLNLIFK